jgi:hypothetical protein
MYGKVLKYKPYCCENFVGVMEVYSKYEFGRVINGWLVEGERYTTAEYPLYAKASHLFGVDFFESDMDIDVECIKKIREYTTFYGNKIYVYDSTHFNIRDVQ